ncbi:Aldehyde dehydrogenase X, mitochondrial [Fusarium culmorum]|uniref:aldehyde dehydrogenase (NAD(+)) n=1 Tax=Fusarium culmorum TaxID=5516 RepID=A0A2T4GZU8_FUSCU|nr:Aldehyde dehydrogenase X, mitochondrial [Fusarium culmorum]
MANFETKLFINNEYVDAKSDKRISVHNPIDGSLVSSGVHVAGPQDVDDAVEAAQAAYAGLWKRFTAAQRSECLVKFADLVDSKEKELAELETIAMGQPTSIAVKITSMMSSLFRYYAGWTDKIHGEQLPPEGGVYKIISHHPYGVVAGISAWNGSAIQLGLKVAPAVAAGNTIVYKMSEKSPLAWSPGQGSWVPTWCHQHPQRRRRDRFSSSISHENSHDILHWIRFHGRKISEAAAKSNLKKVALELGGKSPVLVFNDANTEKAIDFCTNMFLFNSGQVCAAPSRVYVQRDIATSFIETLKTRYTQAASGLGGDPKDPSTFMGPLADGAQYERVMSYIDSGNKEAELAVGGHRVGDQGYFVAPTIFVNPKSDAKVLREEIFGPVLTVVTFDTEEEALELANDTEYGLAAYVWTESLSRGLRMSDQLEAGVVGINGGSLGAIPMMSVGGFKQSGTGSESGYEGIREYLQSKATLIAMT